MNFTFDPSAICVQYNVLHDRHHFPVTGILLLRCTAILYPATKMTCLDKSGYNISKISMVYEENYLGYGEEFLYSNQGIKLLFCNGFIHGLW